MVLFTTYVTGPVNIDHVSTNYTELYLHYLYENDQVVATLMQLCKVVTRLWQFVQGVCNLAEF